MSHITYNEFKNRFGDLGITKYTKAMWLEAGCEEIGVVKGSDFRFQDQSSSTTKRYRLSYTLNDIDNGGIRLTKGIYCYSLNTVSDGRSFDYIQPFDIYTISSDVLDIILPLDWTNDQCEAYLKDKVILYKKKPAITVINPAIKKEGQLGMIMNANGELQSGSGSVGSFKYEVTGGHTYDVVNAKAASSSYVKWLDANGNQIGSITVLNSTNFPKVGDTRPMAMPDNCKYVWLLKDSSKVDLPIALIS